MNHGPLSYHIPTEDTASVPPHNIIDLQNTPEITTNGYHHLVTAEIGKFMGKQFSAITIINIYKNKKVIIIIMHTNTIQ